MGNYLYFGELRSKRKTKVFEVTSIAAETILGFVSFYPAWRKYVFRPGTRTLYDASCLREIADFVEAETKRWRENLR